MRRPHQAEPRRPHDTADEPSSLPPIVNRQYMVDLNNYNRSKTNFFTVSERLPLDVTPLTSHGGI